MNYSAEDRYRIWLCFFFYFLQHREKSVNAICKLTVLCREQFNPIKGAIQDAVSVESKQLHRKILSKLKISS